MDIWGLFSVRSCLEIDEAISLLKMTVKENGTNDSKHMDLGLVPAEKREIYLNALKIIKLAIVQGKITQDEFAARVHLTN
jgi:hypothetical protein